MTEVSCCENNKKIYLWQNNMCVTYLVVFKRMEEFLTQNGCHVVESAEEADWIVVGSCGSFHKAIEANFDKLEEYRALGAQVAVYGCLPKITPERYKKISKDIALYVDTRRPEDIGKILDDIQVEWNDIPEGGNFRDIDYNQFTPSRRYVVVQHGCDAECIFCPHRVGIGRQVSVPKDDLVANIRKHLDDGADTIFLEGRDTGSWGTDFDSPSSLPDLLRAVLEIDVDFKLYINQLGGNWLVRYNESGDDLMELLTHPKLVNIHMPLQTTSDRLLGLMRREAGTAKLESLLEALIKREPRPILRTDMMIGFPTETEAEFEDSVAFMKKYFDEVAVYGFEIHPNTKIARMDLPVTDPAIVKRRVESALEFFSEEPAIVWHCGGQDVDSVTNREKKMAKFI